MSRINKYLIFAAIFELLIETTSGTTNILNYGNLSDICPYTDFCTQKAKSNSSRLTDLPCCASCMCTADCHLYGNCCPDVQHRADDTSPAPVCYFPVFNADEKTLYNLDRNYFTGINSYNAFVACPSSYPDGNVKVKCERFPKQFTDLTLVSDMKGYVYKNKYCAKCHGRTHYRAWNLKIKCLTTDHEIKIQMSQSLDQFKPCMVWSISPMPRIGENSLCYKTVDTCNITGAMMSYSTALEDACKAYTLYYFDTRELITQLFQNVHCFLCNQQGVVPQNICPRGMQNVRDSIIVDFTGVLNTASLNILSRPVEPACRKRCLKWQIYDPLFNMCRRLSCPLSSSAFYGECLSKYENTFGFSMSMLIDLRPVLNHPNIRLRDVLFDYPDNYYDMITLAWAVANTTNQFKSNCGFCNTIIAETGNDADWHLEALVTFHTNLRCDINTLFESAYSYAQNPKNFITVDINSKKLVYKANVKADLTARYIHHLYRSHKVKDERKLCSLPLPFNGEAVCPTVTLNETEYSILLKQTEFRGPMKRKTRLQNINKDEVSGEKGRDVTVSGMGFNNALRSNKEEIRFDYDLCLKDYMKAVGSCNSIHKASLTNGFIMLLCVLLHFVKFLVHGIIMKD